jgi:hypothetical protein
MGSRGFTTRTAPSGSCATLAEIDKRSGEALAPRALQGVATQAAWAVSFYGGDFYVYTAPGVDGGAAATQPEESLGPSTVTRFRPSDGSVDVVVENAGFTIGGAGVSTCAPTEAVR